MPWTRDRLLVAAARLLYQLIDRVDEPGELVALMERDDVRLILDRLPPELAQRIRDRARRRRVAAMMLQPFGDQWCSQHAAYVAPEYLDRLGRRDRRRAIQDVIDADVLGEGHPS